MIEARRNHDVGFPVRYADVHYVYVLRSLEDGNLDTGYTTELPQRVADHHGGKARATRPRRPEVGGASTQSSL